MVVAAVGPVAATDATSVTAASSEQLGGAAATSVVAAAATSVVVAATATATAAAMTGVVWPWRRGGFFSLALQRAKSLPLPLPRLRSLPFSQRLPPSRCRPPPLRLPLLRLSPQSAAVVAAAADSAVAVTATLFFPDAAGTSVLVAAVPYGAAATAVHITPSVSKDSFWCGRFRGHCRDCCHVRCRCRFRYRRLCDGRRTCRSPLRHRCHANRRWRCCCERGSHCRCRCRRCGRGQRR